MQTIPITRELLVELDKKKSYNEESYEQIIWRLLDDCMELSQSTQEKIRLAELDIKKGNVYSLAQVKKELKL